MCSVCVENFINLQKTYKIIVELQKLMFKLNQSITKSNKGQL